MAVAAGHPPWWSTGVENRVKGSSCPSCADYGHNPTKPLPPPAWLYFLRHPRWELLQIGITNVPDLRLGQHQRRRDRPLAIVGQFVWALREPRRLPRGRA
jgi:hypothetical protein